MHPLSSSPFSPHECKILINLFRPNSGTRLHPTIRTLYYDISNHIYVQAMNGLASSAARLSGDLLSRRALAPRRGTEGPCRAQHRIKVAILRSCRLEGIV